MSGNLINPLQNLLTRAAQTLPATTGKVATQQARMDRRAGQVIILADISASMSEAAPGGQRKIDVLREAVSAARAQRASARLFAFSRKTREVESVPEPEANTGLAEALEHVRKIDPGVTLVISDGQPDHPAEALKVARTYRGVIDVLYVGSDKDHIALEFMRQLAAAAGGDVRAHDVARLGGAKLLAGHISGLLR